MRARSALYQAARILGDLQAAQRGPAPLGRRLVRKQAYRITNRALARGLRRAGL